LFQGTHRVPGQLRFAASLSVRKPDPAFQGDWWLLDGTSGDGRRDAEELSFWRRATGQVKYERIYIEDS